VRDEDERGGSPTPAKGRGTSDAVHKVEKRGVESWEKVAEGIHIEGLLNSTREKESNAQGWGSEEKSSRRMG